MQSLHANVCPLLKETTVVGILRIYQKLEPGRFITIGLIECAEGSAQVLREKNLL
jgi:hypothetical protein